MASFFYGDWQLFGGIYRKYEFMVPDPSVCAAGGDGLMGATDWRENNDFPFMVSGTRISELRRRKDALYAERAEHANTEVQIRLLLELVDEMVKDHIHTCDTLCPGEAMVLACFSSGKIFGKSVEISPGFCYNIGVSLCSRAGVKNPRWQADT